MIINAKEEKVIVNPLNSCFKLPDQKIALISPQALFFQEIQHENLISRNVNGQNNDSFSKNEKKIEFEFQNPKFSLISTYSLIKMEDEQNKIGSSEGPNIKRNPNMIYDNVYFFDFKGVNK